MGVRWGELRRQADAQADVVSRAQCLQAGMSPGAVRWRITSGRWRVSAEGVYLTAPGRQDWLVKAHTALLRTQSRPGAPDVALCGESAAYLWGMRGQPPARVDLVIPHRRTVRVGQDTRVRRSMRWNGLVDAFASPPRTTRVVTVVDLASSGTPLDALSTVARAMQKEWVSDREVLQEIIARGGHRYSGLLRSALSDLDDGAESGAEFLFVRDVEGAHGLPAGVRQQGSTLGGGRRHDNGYPSYRLVVEVDGRLGHEHWSDRVRDGRRDRLVLGRRQATARVFFSDVAVTPCDTAAELGVILRGRGWTGEPRPCRRRTCTLRRPAL